MLRSSSHFEPTPSTRVARGALGHLRAALAGVVLLALGASAGAQITIDPDSIELSLAPGEVFIEEKLVRIPGGDPSVKVDVYFLADTTGSMFSVLANVRTNAEAVLNALSGKIGDVRFGVGEYKDFPFDPFCFRNNTSITSNLSDVTDGMDLWLASGGADGPEGQLFALDQIADPGDPSGIGFRSDAQKIIVWFGDAPGHDPVCAAISGLGYDITEASVRAKLVANNFTVVAIGTTTGFPDELNDNPTLGGDYVGACGAPGGSPGQATRITSDTGGTYFENVPPAEVSQAIIDAVDAVVADVTVALVPAGATAPWTMVLTPAYVDVPLPPAGEFLELVFEVKFTGPPCVPGTEGEDLVGTVDCLVDGANAVQQDVLLHVPACDACFTMDFETDDTGNPMAHGAKVDAEFDGDGAYPIVTAVLNGSGLNTAAILNSSTGPATQDPDLLVGRGNILILQTDANLSECPPASGIYCTHNDADDGGTLTFSWTDGTIVPTSITLIDVDATDGAWQVVLTDGAFATRTYTVPANWTGDYVNAGPAFGVGVLDLTTLANQPGFGSIATAAQDVGFDPSAVVEIRVVIAGSGAVDDVSWCVSTAGMPRATVLQRNGTHVNRVELDNMALPVLGGTWGASIDCSDFGTGVATIVVSTRAIPGVMTPHGERLISGRLVANSSYLFAGSMASFTWNIPNDPTLIGRDFHVQGSCRSPETPGGGKILRARIGLSNALDLVVGF